MFLAEATFSGLGTTKQPVCYNPAIRSHPKKEPRKKLKASELTDFLCMPFGGQSIVELVDSLPWSPKHNSLGVSEVVAEAGHDVRAKLVTDDRAFCPLGAPWAVLTSASRDAQLV